MREDFVPPFPVWTDSPLSVLQRRLGVLLRLDRSVKSPGGRQRLCPGPARSCAFCVLVGGRLRPWARRPSRDLLTSEVPDAHRHALVPLSNYAALL